MSGFVFPFKNATTRLSLFESIKFVFLSILLQSHISRRNKFTIFLDLFAEKRNGHKSQEVLSLMGVTSIQQIFSLSKWPREEKGGYGWVLGAVKEMSLFLKGGMAFVTSSGY